MDTNMVNKKNVSLRQCRYVEAESMEKFINTEAELKKALLIKKACAPTILSA